MKTLIFTITAFFVSALCFANCTNAYASAGYGLSHAKKSMEANNFDHQQYYAERALQAFEKARYQNENCGCPGAADPILDGIENLQTALNQDKWDDGRFYTKKALQNAEQLLTSLDICTLGQATETPPDEDQNDLASTEDLDLLSEDTTEIPDGWEAKLALKEMSEEKILALEKSIRDLAVIFECDKALQIIKERKGKSEAELRNENLTSVRSYYLSEVVAIHNKALFAMLECSRKQG
jgi:hypothetical protein